MQTKRLMLSCLVSLFIVFQAHADDKSCVDAIGEKRSASLVEQCINVSPATHPPCNAANSCEMISNEIERGCDFLTDDPKAPDYCKFALTKPETFRGVLIGAAGTDDLRVTVLLSDGRRLTAYCGDKCSALVIAEDEGEATLLPDMSGKNVKITVASESNKGRIAGPAEDDTLIFVKKIERVK